MAKNESRLLELRKATAQPRPLAKARLGAKLIPRRNLATRLVLSLQFLDQRRDDLCIYGHLHGIDLVA